MYSIDRLVLPAPAKINRFLHITGRRADGYHQLQTLLQFLDYGDELIITPHSQLMLDTASAELRSENNLILQAARLLQQTAGCTQGAHITLNKKLPVGGGLGGGSSNAATALLGLNIVWQLGLQQDQLAALGLMLGADVPFFVHGCSAFAEGIGEQLVYMEPSEPWYVVLIPSISISTAAMYGHEDLTRDTSPITVCSANDHKGTNDFEPLVRRLYPEVDSCLTMMDDFDHLSMGSAMLSGSGACVFKPFASQEAANSVLAALNAEANGFIARGINRSPLHSLLCEH
ncbi:MAG: 4-(cytidine 5'-diphospho)-2-C-methyl-D-erythritol kinase [Endozoicomonas sp. (ex Botrylloides leachii)]|nr:4-(cytidine 5'-diphospho)-2-C-methyl-D-erythritol kinase [Endozoicomonas sp. (ex Botrylloides leachii)]